MAPVPHIRPAGLSGLLVRFADQVSEPANRAALAFRATLEAQRVSGQWPGLLETSSALASVFLRFDLTSDVAASELALEELVRGQNWEDAALPGGRALWRIPCAWGGRHGPDLPALAASAGLSEDAACRELAATRVRVLALGFAPGQPYLGPLPQHWDLPRRTELNPQIPAGAVALAIRQLVLFANASPTGWSHVGQTAFRVFQPGAEEPIPLNPADELELFAVSGEEMDALLAGEDPMGGATRELVP